jgi:hypothetical protein
VDLAGLDGLSRHQTLALLEVERLIEEEAAAATPALPLLEWTETHRVINDAPMQIQTIPWLRDLYRVDAPEVWVKKASQVFVSEWLLNTALWLADTGHGGRGNAGYVFPKQAQMNDFVHARVDTAIESSPYLARRVGVTESGAKAVDNVGLKRVGKGHCYFRGSDQRHQLLSLDLDGALMDEVEEFTDGTIELARKRLGSARKPMIRAGSTPKFPGSGISKIFDTTTQHHYFLRCEACGERQDLQFPRNLTRDGNLVCHRCLSPLDPTSEGEWVAAHPGAAAVGFHVNKLYSPRADLVGLARIGYAIEDGLESNTAKIQEFHNQDLGNAYAPEGGSLSQAIIEACERPYDFPGAIVGFPVVMGVDVGAVLHVTVWCRAPNDDPDATRLLFATTTGDWADLDRLMLAWKVNRCVIDGMPEDGKAMAFARRFPGRVYAAFFPNMNAWKHTDAAIWKSTEPVVLIHRTRALDDLFARFIQQKQHLPNGSGHIRGFHAHLKAPIRVVSTDANGQSVARYDEGSAADHWCFSTLYAYAAWSAMRGAVGGNRTSEYGVSAGNAVHIAAPVKRADEADDEFENRQAVYAAERQLLVARKRMNTLTAASRNRTRVGR